MFTSHIGGGIWKRVEDQILFQNFPGPVYGIHAEKRERLIMVVRPLLREMHLNQLQRTTIVCKNVSAMVIFCFWNENGSEVPLIFIFQMTFSHKKAHLYFIQFLISAGVLVVD